MYGEQIAIPTTSTAHTVIGGGGAHTVAGTYGGVSQAHTMVNQRQNNNLSLVFLFFIKHYHQVVLFSLFILHFHPGVDPQK